MQLTVDAVHIGGAVHTRALHKCEPDDLPAGIDASRVERVQCRIRGNEGIEGRHNAVAPHETADVAVWFDRLPNDLAGITDRRVSAHNVTWEEAKSAGHTVLPQDGLYVTQTEGAGADCRPGHLPFVVDVIGSDSESLEAAKISQSSVSQQ